MKETRLAQRGSMPATLPSVCGGGLQGTAARCSPDTLGWDCVHGPAPRLLCVSLRWLEQLQWLLVLGGNGLLSFTFADHSYPLAHRLRKKK